MSGYYHAKRKKTAEQYLEERNLALREKAMRDEKMERSRDWLAAYRLHPRLSKFDWRPNFAYTITPDDQPPEETHNGEELIEGEYTELADAAAFA